MISIIFLETTSRIVPAEDDWCKGDISGTLQILGDIKLGQNETTSSTVGSSNFSLHTNGSLTRITGNEIEEHFESVEFCVIPLYVEFRHTIYL